MTTDIQRVIFAAQLAASLILENGGETYRAEETAGRIGQAFGCNMDIIALPTGLTMTVAKGGESASSIARISRRTVDLSKLEAVNAVSRALTAHSIDLDEGAKRLEKIRDAKTPGGWGSVLAAGGSAAMFAVMFGGGWFEFLVAGLVSAAIQALLIFVPDQGGVPLGCLLGGFLAAALALVAASVCGRGNVSLIVWSIMMPQLPGLAFTNGIRDSMRGDMVSGGARITDAVMRAVVLAGGAGVAMWCYLRLGGAATWLM
ncbi:MAG: threonine/serine exporter family protein [Clostridia bacterium]|nr:threonine/serine exporter family protein [Clostridia bacterium]MBO4884036.1 threonine/serine exporter family protein [Clostridia bacterium]MBR4441790.1 threonine/serine exporter family protein [Clostridia bacterium]